jgi:cyclopropane fatty-acyl-phospholipid synthase-like methyltransferase
LAQTEHVEIGKQWSERRKRNLLLAALGKPRYEAACELGCGEGDLTKRLATRTESLMAVDASTTALGRCEHEVRNLPQVRIGQATLPDEFPVGQYDLIVYSELGYILGENELDDLVMRMQAALHSNGELMAVHWRDPSPDHPRDGDRVHDKLLEGLGALRHVSCYSEAEFRLDSWTHT